MQSTGRAQLAQEFRLRYKEFEFFHVWPGKWTQIVSLTSNGVQLGLPVILYLCSR